MISLDHLNFFINLCTLIFGGLVSYFWVRPADRKLKKLEADLNAQNARQNSIQKALIESHVEHHTEFYRKTCDSCMLVYRAFLKVYSSSNILTTCESLKSLFEISSSFRNRDMLQSFAGDLEQLIPPQWEQSPVIVEANEAEPFVPVRVWNLYATAKTLLSSVQMQIYLFSMKIDTEMVEKQKILSQITSVFPDERSALETWGTSRYRTILERCKRELISELRKIFGMEPIDTAFAQKLDCDISTIFPANKIQIPKEFQSSSTKGSDC